MKELRFRQIHLDYHTGPDIPDAGRDFDAGKFAKAYKDAHVDSVTVFGKCHHGFCYYPTKAGVMHPSLTFDLMGEQIEALHAADIRAPVYLTCAWDDELAKKHPEWQQIDIDGKPFRPERDPDGTGWYTLCLNTPMVDVVAAHTEEVLRGYETDGFFYDIVYQWVECCCPWCRDSMKPLGLDVYDPGDRAKHTRIVYERFMKRLSSLVRRRKRSASIFYNGQASPDMRPMTRYYTHVEIEALPTGEWDYFYFPFYARYYRKFGMDMMGMTGKFHKSWADFGALKTPAQLKFECATMLAVGARCSVGDQLHPRGVPDRATYQVIGEAYKMVEELEPWCRRAVPVTEAALLALPAAPGRDLERSETGCAAAKLLVEAGIQFDVIAPEDDFGTYPLLIVADEGIADEKTAKKLSKYLAGGGKLLFTDRALLDPMAGRFSLRESPVKYVGPGEFQPEYWVSGRELADGIPRTRHVLYERSSWVAPVRGARVLARQAKPYYNRAPEHYCSHRQTPDDRVTRYPGAVMNRKGNVLYLANPLFGAYYRHGYPVYKRIVANAARLLLGEPLVKVKRPASTEVGLMRQRNRLVAHVVRWAPQRRSGAVEYFEDIYPIRDVPLVIRTDRAPKRVRLAPSKQTIDFTYDAPYCEVVIPEIGTSQVVAFEF